MKNKFKLVIVIVMVMVFAAIAAPALAADSSLQSDISGQLQGLGTGAGYKAAASDELPRLVGKIINIFLSILGVLFVVLMVYGGYLWMTSFGNEQKVTKAKDLMIDAVIGLIIIMAAYVIASFVVSRLVEATAK